MLIGKKGIALEKLVLWTIILIAFFLILFTVKRIVSSSGPLESEIICRDSLILRSKTNINIANQEIVASPDLCKTIDKKFSVAKKEEALDFFARSMERCWWIWLEGRVSEVFGPKGIFGSDSKTKCFVCNTLTYQKGPTFTKGELLSHLGKIKSKYKNSDVLSYIQEGDRGYVNLYEEAYTSEKIYALVFASNIEAIWRVPLLVYDYDPPNKQNGLWLLDLNKFSNEKPCYYQPDVAGQ